jgi:hypothetical protein
MIPFTLMRDDARICTCLLLSRIKLTAPGQIAGVID